MAVSDSVGRHAKVDLHGRLIRCGVGEFELRPDEIVRLYHDGSHWQFCGTAPTRRLLWFPSEDVTRIAVSDATRVERRTPDWAMALGFLGLLCFFVGAVFFFVKRSVVMPAALVELTLASGHAIGVEVANIDGPSLAHALGSA